MNIRWILACLLLLSQSAWAGGKIDQLDSLSQNLFKDLTSNMGNTIGYRAIMPGDPLNSLGFEVSSTEMETDTLNLATGGSTPGNLTTPSLSMRTELPLGIDIGGYYSSVPSSNITLMGGQVSYSLTDGGDVVPAVAIRGTFSQLSGVENFDLMTRGLELSVSKGFDRFTPYAGLGTVWIDGETTESGLSDESLVKNKYFMGFIFNLGLMSIAAEAEQTGDNATTSAKFGMRF